MTTKSNGVIYESPDGGLTVYKRNPGSTERVLYHRDPGQTDYARLSRLAEILKLAKTDSEINSLLEQLEVLYILKTNG